jgi:hypothetical protein
MNTLNTREKIAAVADWLGWQEETLSYGLRCVEDAFKLYDYWQSNEDLPEMADEDYDDEDVDLTLHRIAAVGYDPMYDKSPNNKQPYRMFLTH